jgi:hypothetical protein
MNDLSVLDSSTQSQFIDENAAAACGYDSPEFIQMLEFAKSCQKGKGIEPGTWMIPRFSGSPLLSYVKQPEVHYTLHVKEGEGIACDDFVLKEYGEPPYAPHALMTSILDGVEVTFYRDTRSRHGVGVYGVSCRGIGTFEKP